MFLRGDLVRLLRELPEIPLPKDAQGTVLRILPTEEGQPQDAEAEFYIKGGYVTSVVPLDACEPMLDEYHSWTAVFWRLEKPPHQFIADAMNVMSKHDFEIRPGINAARLVYNAKDRFWKRKEAFRDPTGAEVIATGPSWDGFIVAFSGPQRFHLEFRLAGRAEPAVFLHQRHEAYGEQRTRTHAAMSLFRVLLNLYGALGAQFCAAPVAGNWLMDESWDTLLREPLFPDLFLIPRSSLPAQLPPLFRTAMLVDDRAVLTTLPIKFAPHEEPIKPSERDLKLSQLRVCKAIGEKAYDQLYESSASRSPTGVYSDAKDAFRDAIRIAEELGLPEEAAELEERLDHIKAVFRSQFS